MRRSPCSTTIRGTIADDADDHDDHDDDHGGGGHEDIATADGLTDYLNVVMILSGCADIV